MTNQPFKPKGPFPLFLADLDHGTKGWPDDMKMRYLRLLDHLWSQGGLIPDDDTYIARAAGIPNSRGRPAQIARLRTKLVVLAPGSIQGTIKRMVPGMGEGSFAEWENSIQRMAGNARVLKEIEKARRRSEIARSGGRARQGQAAADSRPVKQPTADEKISSPTPSPSKEREDRPGESSAPSENTETPRARKARSPKGKKDYAFLGKVIRLTIEDHEAWQRAYYMIPDLYETLCRIDAQYDREMGDEERNNWFIRCSKALRKEHNKLLERAEAQTPKITADDPPWIARDRERRRRERLELDAPGPSTTGR